METETTIEKSGLNDIKLLQERVRRLESEIDALRRYTELLADTLRNQADSPAAQKPADDEVAAAKRGSRGGLMAHFRPKSALGRFFLLPAFIFILIMIAISKIGGYYAEKTSSAIEAVNQGKELTPEQKSNPLVQTYIETRAQAAPKAKELR